MSSGRGACGRDTEVLGDAATFFDPTCVDELADAITQVLGGGDRVALLRARGYERSGSYTWQRTVDATLRGYELIAG